MSDHRAPYPPHPDMLKYTKCERCFQVIDWARAITQPLCDRCYVESVKRALREAKP